MRIDLCVSTFHVVCLGTGANLHAHLLCLDDYVDFLACRVKTADPSGLAVRGVSLRPLACGGCGFESCRGHECLFLVSVMFCQVEVSASG